MSKGYKGGDFEREVCKKLSLWWTGGERDDVFWRSSQSGGRATQRKKKGLSTYGSYGDIAAVDPIGEPLLRLFTIELKRGDSYGTLWDLFDALPTEASRSFEKCLAQAMRSADDAGTAHWMLICRQDRRVPVIYFEMNQTLKELGILKLPHMRFRFRLNGIPSPLTPYLIVVHFETFLSSVHPKQIIEIA